MSNRVYRIFIGAALLVLLFFKVTYGMYAIIGLLFLEGITNFRLPLIVAGITGRAHATDDTINPGLTIMDAERGWRLMVAVMLFISFVLLNDVLWVFPWFMGLSIFGAGISGVCPMLALLHWVGLK